MCRWCRGSKGDVTSMEWTFEFRFLALGTVSKRFFLYGHMYLSRCPGQWIPSAVCRRSRTRQQDQHLATALPHHGIYKGIPLESSSHLGLLDLPGIWPGAIGPRSPTALMGSNWNICTLCRAQQLTPRPCKETSFFEPLRLLSVLCRGSCQPGFWARCFGDT